MRIAFDLRRIKNPGIGRYMQCLCEAVLAQETRHEFLLILPPDAQETIANAKGRAEKLSCGLKYYSLQEQLELPRILRRHRIDLLHSPHFVLPLMGSCTTVATIHDVIYLACKDDLPSWTGRMYYRGMMSASARKADRIITVSEFSKADIVRFLKVDPARIEVVYSGVSPVFQPVRDPSRIQQVRRQYGISGEFILYTGIYKPRKNHEGLFRAMQKLVAGGVCAQLVIAGSMNEGHAELKKLAAELKIADRVIFTGFLNDSDLAALYTAARVYACPSLYEGFGFTVLEAMACGTPVVCSSATSLPEIAGEAAVFADPRNPDDFACALAYVFSDDELRARLVTSGYENCRRFSWPNAAAKTIAVYESAAEKALRKVVYA
ncbi:MAG TPA: glycosyltransferase family 1 protein [Candidatus Angelobacter sp.]